MDVSRRRAKLIARDQIGKLNGRINASRLTSIGIDKFIWRTSKDERVRPDHRKREGKIYEFSNPPNGEIPGTPINCRCFAEPVIS